MKSVKLLSWLFLLSCFSLTAQTTHFIDWELSVGSNASITIDVGDTVEWTNIDLGMPHDVSSTDPNAPAGFGSGTLNDLDTYSFTFNTAVVFDYGCGFHPGSMDGTITVVDPSDCNSDFYDTGGVSGNYSNSEDEVWTFYPDNPGDFVTVTFSVFDVEATYDALYVFDGPDINAPMISSGNPITLSGFPAGGFYGTTPPGPFTSTDPSGALTFRFRSDGSQNFQGWEAFVSCAPLPSCFAPENPSFSNVLITTADFNWDASPTETDGYEYVVMDTGDAPDPSTAVATGTTGAGVLAISVSGLAPDSSYDFYVRADCGATDGLSDWSIPVSFNTLCAVFDVFPFTESFEDSSTSRGCWTQIQEVATASWTFATGSSGGSITTANSGTLNAQFVSQSGFDSPVTKLVSPAFDLSNMSSATLDFYYGQEDWGGDQNELKVYYRTGMTDPWVEIAHYINDVNTWTAVSLALPNLSASYQIAFEGINNYGRANVIDDVVIDGAALVCDAPADPILVIVDVTTAEVSWTASATETDGYDWVVMDEGEEPDTDTPVASGSVSTGITTVIVTDLDEQTTYDFYVRTNCDSGDVSDWEGPLTFTTDATASTHDAVIEGFTFHPNPIDQVVNISAQNTIDKVVIFNLMGQKLIDNKIEATSSQLNVSGFAPGVYLMKVSSNGQTAVYRLIKK